MERKAAKKKKKKKIVEYVGKIQCFCLVLSIII